MEKILKGNLEKISWNNGKFINYKKEMVYAIPIGDPQIFKITEKALDYYPLNSELDDIIYSLRSKMDPKERKKINAFSRGRFEGVFEGFKRIYDYNFCSIQFYKI